jgi:hypothetical protein
VAKSKVEWIEQGDVCLVPITEAEYARSIAQLRPIDDNGIVALGEATGHRHRIAGSADLWGDDRVRCFRVTADTEMLHDEHRAVPLRREMFTGHAGAYRVGIVQEFDHFAEEARAVQD